MSICTSWSINNYSLIFQLQLTADYRENTGKNKGAGAYNTSENCLEEEEKNYPKVTRRIKTIVVFTSQLLVLQLAHKNTTEYFPYFL